MSSMLTEMAKGKTLDEARKITNKDVAAALEGLPKNKLHCSNLGADALGLAIKNYESQKGGKPAREALEKLEVLPTHGGEKCYCPYCDSELEEGETVCKSCQLAV